MLSQICLFFSVTELKSPSGETFTIATRGVLERAHLFIFPGSDRTGERYLYGVCVRVVLRTSGSGGTKAMDPKSQANFSHRRSSETGRGELTCQLSLLFPLLFLYVAQDSLEFMLVPLQPPERWNHRGVLPRPG